ncbi:4-hydroxy-tetrahydrodipicolinate synthase [Bradyrhizobium sp. U87765 SZCCT0131]|uniref:4-hydroxy-tetrahydrodipicolinate synthase n=1 Tax=unclassified Bradyrhizobium TaxID=2631580 RepID=UPI001BA73FF1|nr:MULTISPECIES: 4-hydroxy-tetrahydrodipicolinate synthase [unclassified Bradyrhizobium]MBR1218697.1 4-hydroxy-tetrahydrodipicolinate synthase [Bradyrhizobium sp. U87765 SZCCT0131]MBR1265544.1 4-hydroxy-tetrahydrodipicolinate synthase [Bradyrhizobium sp. U87765 SZCCT0134]MBR1304195.1 4-hydroxy-tetrahydrodipicolinate synthase [Bradyrhizobium sp. U87765 SZCCT0110]MBR1319801.1 4-hydroxy-tetrahydrodipicolinate synthase [Bradyrhizobium sp. U87765 SZCCT0109]MBR1348126.1 4-hydroxy-tetrahydrodipicolin
MTTLSGVWAPLVTPFRDGRLDIASTRRLIEHLLAQGVAGFIPLGTTGESPTLDDDEIETMVAETVAAVAGRVPVFVGIGGNATHKVIRAVRRLSAHPFDGILSVCPYYNRPTQDGLRAHFTAIAGETDRKILIYNIPYRTSINLANDTVLRLAEQPNIVGIKDSSGSLTQSLELLALRPWGFSVLTGEDALFLTMLANGADGGILASCHLATDAFVAVAERMAANDQHDALARWTPLSRLVGKLFGEPNPVPLKYALWRQGLIASPECRLPLTPISAALAQDLDQELARLPQATEALRRAG